MDSVKSFVLCALLAAAISGVVNMLSSGMKGFEKYTGLVASLVMILVLAKPMCSLARGVMDEISSVVSDYAESEKNSQEDEKSENIASDHVRIALEETVKDILCRHFSIDGSDISISAVFADDMSVEGVVIYIGDESLSSEIESYVETSLLIPAEIKGKEKK